MSRVEEIENAVGNLSKQEFERFVAWLEDFKHDQWDSQIEADSKAGKLDALAEQAVRDYQAGLCKPL